MRAIGVFAALFSAVVVAAGVGPAQAQAYAQVAAQAAAPVVSSASTPADAAQLAATEGQPVVVDSLTTPTEQTTAQPDGTMQYQVSSVPVRAMVAGSWVPVDTTLQEGTDWLVPKASARPVRFSEGGSDVLDQVQTPGGDWVTDTWPDGTLPAPTVSGSTATYANVLPGVDLKLTATDVGMATVYVVNSAAAASSVALSDLHVVTSGATLAQQASGIMTATPGPSAPASASVPLWWDSSDGGTFQGPGGDDPQMPVDSTWTSAGVAMNVGGTVAAKSVTYPLFVDPDWSSGDTSSWYTDAAYPTVSYLSASSSDVLRVGIYPPYKSDMFFQFPISALVGKTVLTAQLGTTQISTDACPTSAIDVHTYGPQTPGFTWNQEQSWSGQWGPVLDSQSPGGCTTSSMTVGWNVTAGVQQKLGQSVIQFAFTFHTSTAWSRRHYSRAATLTVTYDTPPSTPTALSVNTPPRGCGTATDPAYVNNHAQALVLQASVADPDPGAKVNASFQIMLASQVGSSNPTLVADIDPGDAPPGVQRATFPTDTLTDGTAYAWRVIAGDRILVSPYSGYCYITVEDTPPGLPQVSTQATGLTVGHPFSATITGTGPVWAYEYWWQSGPVASGSPELPVAQAVNTGTALATCPPPSGPVRYVCTTGDSDSVTLTVAPVDDTSTLWVAAYDKAGNVSVDAAGAPAGAGLQVTAAADPAIGYTAGHAWITDNLAPSTSTATTTVPDANTTAGTSISSEDDLALNGDATIVADGGATTVPPNEPVFDLFSALGFSGASTSTAVESARQAVDTTQSFTVSAWVNPGSAAATGVHAVLAQSGATDSGFSLQAGDGAWQFCVRAQHPEGTPVCARADAGPATGTPVFLAGVWDAANQQARLLVGDSIAPAAVAARTPVAGDVSAAGPVTVGSDQVSGGSADFWAGEVEDPAVFPGVVDGNQLQQLFNQSSF